MAGFSGGLQGAECTWQEPICSGEGILEGPPNAAGPIHTLCAICCGLDSVGGLFFTAACATHTTRVCMSLAFMC